jgi:hypothetical protein
MALHWNLKRCDQSACWDSEGNMSGIAHGLIWATLAIGLNEITEANVSEWCWRLNFEVRMHGERAILTKTNPSDGTSGGQFDEMDLRPFIGLNTNASKRTRKQYLASVMQGQERDHNYAEHTRKRANAERVATGGAS